QGFDDLAEYGPEGANDVDEAVAFVDRARTDGYCYTDSVFEVGTATIAVPVRRPDHRASAVLSIAGPSVRLTHDRALSLLPNLREAAEQLLYVTAQPAETAAR